MSAMLIVGNERIEFNEFEWELLKKYIIKDTIEFWDSVSQEVDGGLLPMELSGISEMIDRNVLFSLKTKLFKIL